MHASNRLTHVFEGAIDALAASADYVFFGAYWDGLYRAPSAGPGLPLRRLASVQSGEVVGIHAAGDLVLFAGWRAIGLYDLRRELMRCFIDEAFWKNYGPESTAETIASAVTQDDCTPTMSEQEWTALLTPLVDGEYDGSSLCGLGTTAVLALECSSALNPGRLVHLRMGDTLDTTDVSHLLTDEGIAEISHLALESEKDLWVVCKLASEVSDDRWRMGPRTLFHLSIEGGSREEYPLPAPDGQMDRSRIGWTSPGRQQVLFLGDCVVIPDVDSMLILNRTTREWRRVFAVPHSSLPGFFAISRGLDDKSVLIGTVDGVAEVSNEQLRDPRVTRLELPRLLGTQDLPERPVHALLKAERVLWIGSSAGLYRYSCGE